MDDTEFCDVKDVHDMNKKMTSNENKAIFSDAVLVDEERIEKKSVCSGNVMKDIDTMATERDNVMQDIDTMTTERDNVMQDIDTMATEQDNVMEDIDAMTTERDNVMEDIDTITTERDNASSTAVMEDEITANKNKDNCSDDVMVNTDTRKKVIFNERKDMDNAMKKVTSSDNDKKNETMEGNEVGLKEEVNSSDVLIVDTTTKREASPNDRVRACNDTNIVESSAGKEITFDENKEVHDNTAMVEHKRTTDLTASGHGKCYGMMDNEKSKEMTSSENNEVCDDSVVKDKSIEQARIITDINRATKSSRATEVHGDVNMDDLSAGEQSFKSTELRIARKVFGDKLLKSHKKDKQERADICFQKTNATNCSNEKSTSAIKTNDSVWDYKVIHVDSCDLQVVGSGDTGEFSSSNSEQVARHVQNVGRKAKSPKERLSTDIKKSQQRPDTSVGHLKFRKILPKPQITLVFNRNVEGQGKQDVMDSISYPVTREQNAFCDTTNRHKENLDTTQSSRPYQCTYCEKMFTEVGDLKKHEGIHTSVSQYKCAYCNKIFGAQSDVTEHERTHTGVKPFECTYCNKTFAEKRHAKEHERTHTSEKSHICTYCNKAFPRQSHLKRHEFIHTGESPHRCTYCGKVFRNKWDVQVHERIHTGVKPFTCKLCNKAFTQRSGLNVHGRVHTGIAPYQCGQCSKAFTRKSHLMEHERIHTGIRPYTCTYCSKSFTQKGTLKKHERTHTGVKPYKCEECDKAFSRRSDLVKHENVHTGAQI